MFLLEAPYVSEYLRQSIQNLGLPVADAAFAREALHGTEALFADQTELARHIQAGGRVYANSENGLDVIMRAAGQSDLARQIEICKDKALFRETIAGLYPGYRFMRARPEDLAGLDVSSMSCPFVAKPARGFFSLGVHMVFDHAEWPDVVQAIEQERASLNAEYPAEVVDAGEFIVEQGIEGEEYAIDVYYTNDGEPVITNILYHQFASAGDVSDRLYYTSAEIMEDWLGPFTDMTRRIGTACGFRNFCMHLEVRATPEGEIIPIEANPLRFAGWCVADLTAHAWGVNPYEHYFGDKRPDWAGILESRQGQVCAMVIGDVPPDVDRAAITAVDYEGFSALFDEVLDLRRMDYRTYPLFAMAFVRARTERLDRLKALLGADFSRFIATR